MSLNGRRGVVERVGARLRAVVVAAAGAAAGSAGMGCGATGAALQSAEPIDVEAELDLLNACAMEALAALAPLERVFPGQRRATTVWADSGPDRIRYASSVYVHPRFGPALTVEPFRQRWVGEASLRAHDAAVHRTPPADGEVGWMPSEFRPEDREVSERTAYLAAQCWSQRRARSE